MFVCQKIHVRINYFLLISSNILYGSNKCTSNCDILFLEVTRHAKQIRLKETSYEYLCRLCFKVQFKTNDFFNLLFWFENILNDLSTKKFILTIKMKSDIWNAIIALTLMEAYSYKGKKFDLSQSKGNFFLILFR